MQESMSLKYEPASVTTTPRFSAFIENRIGHLTNLASKHHLCGVVAGGARERGHERRDSDRPGWWRQRGGTLPYTLNPEP